MAKPNLKYALNNKLDIRVIPDTHSGYPIPDLSYIPIPNPTPNPIKLDIGYPNPADIGSGTGKSNIRYPYSHPY